jgi:hypothetical protein
MIFQLPVYSFPEDIDYDHMRGYLQSDKLRWSAGAMKDRQIYKWQKEVEKKSVPEMLEELAIFDFSGIYIDRAGPTPFPPKLEEQISVLLCQKPLVSQNGRMAFYSLLEYKGKIREGVSKDEMAERARRYLNPFALIWKKDFSPMEGTQEKNWHWSGPTGELHIENTLDYSREVTMEMSIDSPKGGTLRVEGNNIISEIFKVTPEPAQWNKTIIVPPGKHIIKFTCDATPIYDPPDPRVFVFRINDFKMIENYLRNSYATKLGRNCPDPSLQIKQAVLR